MWRPLKTLALGVLLPGCIIGTWPIPEARDSEIDEARIGEESCDGLDNDGDGVVDEGCPCQAGSERGCVGEVGGQCGLGVQHCEGGEWGGCGSVGPPWSASRAPAVEIVDVSPAVLVRGGSETQIVRAEVTVPCPGIQVPRLDVILEAATPQVRVLVTARDDGSGGDLIAGDGELAATLVNVFGPGVPAQTLTLSLRTFLNGDVIFDSVAVELEEP